MGRGGTVIPDPRGGHVWIYGIDGSGNPVRARVDADGYLQVDGRTLPLPAGAATQTTLAALLTELEGRNPVDHGDTPVIYNVTMTNANTEYSQALPANTKKFLIKCRGAYDIKVCFTSSGSGTLYVTVPSGTSYWEDAIQPSSITLYFQCATAAQVAEIVAWS